MKEANATYCSNCKTLLIKRTDYNIINLGLMKMENVNIVEKK